MSKIESFGGILPTIDRVDRVLVNGSRDRERIRQLELAVEIVKGYSAQGTEISYILGALDRAFNKIRQLSKVEEEIKIEDNIEEKMDWKDSIRRDVVLCMECGRAFKQLRRKHIGEHGMTLGEYRRKWSIPKEVTLSAKEVTRRRKEIARETKLGIKEFVAVGGK